MFPKRPPFSKLCNYRLCYRYTACYNSNDMVIEFFEHLKKSLRMRIDIFIS
jgi:hypothetical protein